MARLKLRVTSSMCWQLLPAPDVKIPDPALQSWHSWNLFTLFSGGCCCFCCSEIFHMASYSAKAGIPQIGLIESAHMAEVNLDLMKIGSKPSFPTFQYCNAMERWIFAFVLVLAWCHQSLAVGGSNMEIATRRGLLRLDKPARLRFCICQIQSKLLQIPRQQWHCQCCLSSPQLFKSTI